MQNLWIVYMQLFGINWTLWGAAVALCLTLNKTGNVPVAYRSGGDWGVQTPPEIPKALQNRAKLNPIVKSAKKCRI